MPNYCVNINAQSNGDHEVHDLSSAVGCLPAAAHRRDLGWFSSCDGAVAAAKKFYYRADGCYRCSPDCHTS